MTSLAWDYCSLTIRALHNLLSRQLQPLQVELARVDVIRKYSDKIDIRVVERAPLLEYLKIMQEANIIIDQCYSYGYGMNAIEALAMGKVVLSGNEEENR